MGQQGLFTIPAGWDEKTKVPKQDGELTEHAGVQCLALQKRKGVISMSKVTQLALREAVMVSFICQFVTSLKSPGKGNLHEGTASMGMSVRKFLTPNVGGPRHCEQ